ncbi:hypothetical protein ONZ43_g5180 [Nemania bipapillata]|uniref:Uncharacterized protein n=1 Tax=Nemania bipapillata TaxID=110536 RepID=A0ACC2IDQ2_9PEZI|nr:hypothetical protein ONZ43_g5180 [Nemania bipapillata]
MPVPSHSNGYHSNAAGAAPDSSDSLRGGVGSLNYEDSDLNSITRSQMNQDLIAYRYDLEFCQTQLTTQPDLSPQEIRTLQIRILDCGHNIRHCKHRVQILDAQARLGLGPYASASAYRSGGTAVPTSRYKRQRVRKSENGAFDGIVNDNGDLRAGAVAGEVDADADADDSMLAGAADGDMAASPGPPTTSFQRLGYWDCRLCRSRKYLEAGSNRVPSAPCKWPLKDISKMINHFLDLHTEHTPEERCGELGDALDRNRGPFEYWLTRTKAQEIENNDIIDDYIHLLQEGVLPDAMRGLLRAATLFPNSVSNSYKK